MESQRYKPTLRCHQCSMVFNSIEQLSKHRDKFCVGTSNHLLYDPYYVTPKPQLAQEKINQLQALKEASARRNDENLLREKLLLNQSRGRAGPSEADHQLQKRGSERKDLEDSSYLSAIDDLRTQIKALRNGQTSVPFVSHPVQPNYHTTTVQPQQQSPVLLANQQADSPTSTQLQALSQQQGNMAFNFSGGSLVAEISALRQHYIHTGGRDPAVLTQLTEMLKDAEQLESANRLPPTTRQEPRYQNHSPSEELVAMEIENYRLQRELMLLQNRDVGTHLPFSDGLSTRMHMDRVLALEREMELAKHQALLDAMRRERKPLNPAHSYYKRIDNIPPAKGYNPNEGFVCFYDFVMGLESSACICRLIVGLYDRVAELGEPSLLPTVYTEMSAGGITAMVGARQPVPQFPPSNDAYIVVELQTSDSTLDELKTKAWLKLNIFNSSHALHAGAWKLAFYSLPIKLDLTTSELASRPAYGDAMLYLRMVHQRDSHAQSEATISAANYIDYQYPPVQSKPTPAPPRSTNEQTPYSWAS